MKYNFFRGQDPVDESVLWSQTGLHLPNESVEEVGGWGRFRASAPIGVVAVDLLLRHMLQDVLRH